MSGQKNKITLRQLTVSALLIALDVVFTRVLAINTPLMKIGLGFTAVAVSAMLYGPRWAALTAALGDLIGALMFPTGAYFPGFTLTAALTGLIFGLFLYRREGKWLRAFFAALTNSFFVTLVLNTLLIAVFFRSSPQEIAAVLRYPALAPLPAELLSGAKPFDIFFFDLGQALDMLLRPTPPTAGEALERVLQVTSLKALLAARVPQFLIMTGVQTAVIEALQASPVLLRLFREKSSEKSEKNP